MNQNHYFAYSGIGLPEHVQHLKEAGYFDRAIRIVDNLITDPATPKCMKENLLAQREIMVRLPMQYPYTKETGLARVQEKIPDFTMEELESYMDKGRITWIFIDGKEHLVSSFFGTLCKEPEIAARLPQEPVDPSKVSHEQLDRTGRLNR